MDLIITVVVYLVVFALIFGAAFWLLGQLALQPPFDRIARGLVALLAFLVVVYLLLSLLGAVSPFPPIIRR